MSTNYGLGYQAAQEDACRIALVLEEKWRNTAKRYRESHKRWFFGWYVDPIADKDARSIEAAADGIAAIRQVIASRSATQPRATERDA